MTVAQPKIGTGLIRSCVLLDTTRSREVDIEPLVEDIGYYENILSPTVSVHLNLRDGVNLKTDLPINGGEFLQLQFSDSFEDSVQIRFDDEDNPLRVYKISNRARDKDRLESYTILCAPDHLLKQQYMAIDRSYIRQPASAIAYNIIGSSFNAEITELDETVGLHTHTFTRITPFQAVNQLITETESASDGSSCFFFFQTNDGYNLRNLNNMLSQPVRKVEVNGQFEELVYNYITGEVSGDDIQYDGTRILQYNEPISFDLLDGILDGQYGVSVKYFDPIRKRMDQTSYLHENDWETTSHSNPKQLISDTISEEFGLEPSVEKFMISNYPSVFSDYITSRDEEIRTSFRRKQNIAAKRQAILTSIKNNKINVVVHGDSRIMAGQTLNINIPTSGQASKTDEQLDKFVSGKYLIVSTQHNITDTDYKTVMTIVKDSNLKSPDSEDIF
mgnify:CR=1 FL=1